MELALLIIIAIVLLCLLIACALAGWGIVRSQSRRHAEIEGSWQRLYTIQQAEIESQRNRLMTKSWEEYHNLQVATPTSLDQAARALPDFPFPSSNEDANTAEELEAQLAEALRAGGADLEGGSWQPTVG